MHLNKSMAALLALSLTALLTGCEAEQTEKDMIAEAQFCLDKAQDSSSANSCMSKIQGLTSPQAYTLRCAAGFISSGVTSPQNLSQALNALKDGGSTAGILGAISFDSQALADQTFTNCALTKNEGLMLIGAMAKTATVLGSLASGSGSMEAQIQTVINNILTDLNSGSPSQQTINDVVKIGGTIQSVYQTTCANGVGAIEDVCDSINGAIASVPGGVDVVNATPEEIGQALLDYWKNLNH